VAVVDAGEAHTVEAAHARIDRLAEAFGRTAEAEAIHASIRETLAALPTRVREASPSVLFVYARGPGMVLVAGADTGPASLLEAAGARNAGASFSSFVPLTAEAVVAADPDILLMPVDGLESVGGPQGLGSLPGVAQTRAWQRGAVATVDDALIQAFGPRVGDAVAAIERALAAHLPTPSVSAR
jgi:iron complex transport system substrate-binding protein